MKASTNLKQKQELYSHFDKDEKQDRATEAYTFQSKQTVQHLFRLNTLFSVPEEKLIKQHDIAAKLSEGTFTADKLVRLTSHALKVARIHGFIKNLKSAQKLGGQLGQMRRLLRVDRLGLILKEYVGFIKKKKLSKHDCFMIIFKAILLVEDIQDLMAFLIQMKVLSGQERLPGLRKTIADIYFIECLGWFVYYLYEYFKGGEEEVCEKNKLSALRYLLDSIVSHNEFSRRKYTLNPKIACLVGLVSSILNVYLVWK